MDKTKALQKLLNGTATKKKIELLGEISIGETINHSVIIICNGKK